MMELLITFLTEWVYAIIGAHIFLVVFSIILSILFSENYFIKLWLIYSENYFIGLRGILMSSFLIVLILLPFYINYVKVKVGG